MYPDHSMSNPSVNPHGDYPAFTLKKKLYWKKWCFLLWIMSGTVDAERTLFCIVMWKQEKHGTQAETVFEFKEWVEIKRSKSEFYQMRDSWYEYSATTRRIYLVRKHSGLSDLVPDLEIVLFRLIIRYSPRSTCSLVLSARPRNDRGSRLFGSLLCVFIRHAVLKNILRHSKT